MNHLSFKEHLFITEARDPGKKYNEVQAKGVVEKVILALEGTDSAAWTRVARRYARLEASLKALAEQRDVLNTKLKKEVSGLFDPSDIVMTRVVQTAQFTLTMAKEIKKKVPASEEINYEQIANALAALIPNELQPKVDEIVKMHTKVIPETEKPGVQKLSVSKEALKEGKFENFVAKVRTWVAATTNAFKKWASRYDDKLEAIERRYKFLKESADDDSAFDDIL